MEKTIVNYAKLEHHILDNIKNQLFDKNPAYISTDGKVSIHPKLWQHLNHHFIRRSEDGSSASHPLTGPHFSPRETSNLPYSDPSHTGVSLSKDEVLILIRKQLNVVREEMKEREQLFLVRAQERSQPPVTVEEKEVEESMVSDMKCSIYFKRLMVVLKSFILQYMYIYIYFTS